jgi:hypothetical protein
MGCSLKSFQGGGLRRDALCILCSDLLESGTRRKRVRPAGH